MSPVVDFRWKGGSMPPSSAQRAEARRIAKAISEVGFCLPGTLLERYMHCQSPGCRCKAEPPQLHGPYWYWTRKVNAKTVSRVFSAEQVEEYQAWFDNERTLRQLVHELEELSMAVADADPRWPKRR
jgi:hypothetical protein